LLSPLTEWAAKIRWLRWPQLIGIVISFLFVGAAIFVLIRDGVNLKAASFRLHPGWLLLSFIVECSGLLFAVPVWRQIMGRFNSRLSYYKDFRIYCYSMLGVAIPGRLWSVAGRAALYKRESISGMTVAVASFVELLVTGLAAFVLFGLTTAVSPATDLWQNPTVALLSTLFAIILIQPPLFNRLIAWLLSRSSQNNETAVKLNYKDLAVWLGAETVVIMIGGTAVYILLYSLTPVPITLLPSIISAWAMAIVVGTLFFWVPGPVIRDGMMTLVLTQVLPTATAVLFVLLVRVWTIASILLLAALIWLIPHNSPPNSAKYYPR
jgi:hypothetical protein